MTDETDALPEPYTNTLLFIIADIRMKSGVGDKPMLTDLADVIADKIKAALEMAERAERERDVALTALFAAESQNQHI